MCTLCITSCVPTFLVVVWVLLLAKLPGGARSRGSGAVDCDGKRHRFEAVLHSPLRTSVVPSKILHCKASNEMVYPASQNFAVARSEA